MNKRIVCNKCGKLFKIKLKTKIHRTNVKESYFRCRHCKERYTAFVLDAECRKLQREVRDFRRNKDQIARRFIEGEIEPEEYIKKIDDIENEINSVQCVLKARMDRLKENFT